MHIPDGFLAANTWVPAWIVSMGGLGYCIKRVSVFLKDKTVPLMGVMAAFIFAAQMLNFPVAAGTSGHLLGGVLAVVLLGPYAGAIVIAVVLAVQCLVFQDGGLTALGANIFNMSFIGAMGGYIIYNVIKNLIGGNKGIIIGTAAAAWASVVLASSACAVELAVSGTSPLRIALPAMALVHMLIGIGEAFISVVVVSFVLKTRPDLIYNNGEEAAYE
ncbi:MAG: energy-coupling factor ABC transporter permease [Candidatus Omnitrophica bacterium]|nr:energy-coupling factor ABC transporter permease [Candidatus Omnitrophota bacterium]